MLIFRMIFIYRSWIERSENNAFFIILNRIFIRHLIIIIIVDILLKIWKQTLFYIWIDKKLKTCKVYSYSKTDNVEGLYPNSKALVYYYIPNQIATSRNDHGYLKSWNYYLDHIVSKYSWLRITKNFPFVHPIKYNKNKDEKKSEQRCNKSIERNPKDNENIVNIHIIFAKRKLLTWFVESNLKSFELLVLF